MKINKINSIIFQSNKSTKRLDRVLVEQEIAGKTFDVKKVFLKNVFKNKELSATPITDYLGNGASALVFETENGQVLKLTHGNHFPLGRPQEDFDVPIYKKGHIGSMYYYFEEKLMQHGLSDGFVLMVRDMIKEKGYVPFDISADDIHQVGISERGTLHLIDPECARFKTVFHALWKKIQILFSNKLSSSHFSKALHK